MKGFPLEFGIGVRGPVCFYDGAIRWSKKFKDRFSRFDTIPAVTDSHPATLPSPLGSMLSRRAQKTIKVSPFSFCHLRVKLLNIPATDVAPSLTKLISECWQRKSCIGCKVSMVSISGRGWGWDGGQVLPNM